MDLALAGRVAVVTGGTSGIGLACVRAFLAEGADVAFCGRNSDRLANAVKALSAEFDPARILAKTCDVTRLQDVSDFAAAVSVWRGHADILVNNAGEGRVSTFANTTDEQWRAELDLKFFSQLYPVRAFQPQLAQSNIAAIVAVNSLLAYQPEPHMVCTSAARAGVQSLLKSLATDLAPAIRVNSVVLGLIESGQWERRFDARADKNQTRDEWLTELARSKKIPRDRLGRPAEVASAIVFLASPAASYITGTSLEISGGVSRYI